MISFNEFIVEMMEHKEIDHNAAHLTWGNQFLHLISSIMMIYVYYLLGCWSFCGVGGEVGCVGGGEVGCVGGGVRGDEVGGLDGCYVGGGCDYYMKMAALITVSAQSMRQGGHFFIEGNATHKEKLKIGYTTDMKKKAIYGFLPFVFVNWYSFQDLYQSVSGYELAMMSYAAIILYRIAWLTFFGDHCLQGIVWGCKIVSDVATDIQLYGPTLWGQTAPKIYVWTKPAVDFYNELD